MLEYVRLTNDSELPSIDSLRPYKAVVVVEIEVTAQRRDAISRWLVNTGCLYMMACGLNCSTWDDSVDLANLGQFNFGEIPEDSFVMTTWHEHDSLGDVFWFAKNSAFHPTIELTNTIIVHLSETDKSMKFKAEYGET